MRRSLSGDLGDGYEMSYSYHFILKMKLVLSLLLLMGAVVCPWISRQKALTEEELQIGAEVFDVHHIRSQVSQYEAHLENFLTTDLITMELPARAEEVGLALTNLRSS